MATTSTELSIRTSLPFLRGGGGWRHSTALIQPLSPGCQVPILPDLQKNYGCNEILLSPTQIHSKAWDIRAEMLQLKQFC